MDKATVLYVDLTNRKEVERAADRLRTCLFLWEKPELWRTLESKVFLDDLQAFARKNGIYPRVADCLMQALRASDFAQVCYRPAKSEEDGDQFVYLGAVFAETNPSDWSKKHNLDTVCVRLLKALMQEYGLTWGMPGFDDWAADFSTRQAKINYGAAV